ncbi:MAG: tripartite tricarboxylate transporter TctB family protein [Desulfobaccales bacterium]
MRAHWNKDYYGGILMVLIGLGCVLEGWRLHLGTLAQMGPGYFPVAVGAILTLTGLGIALKAMWRPEKDKPLGMPDWRAWGSIIGGMVAFMILGIYGGLLPATFAIVLISAFGDKTTTLKQALCLAGAMAVISITVFRWALDLQFPLFGWRW